MTHSLESEWLVWEMVLVVVAVIVPAMAPGAHSSGWVVLGPHVYARGEILGRMNQA